MSGNKYKGSPRYLNEIKEQVKAVNYVFEILDARAPQSTGNRFIREITDNNKSIIILNKSDLAQKDVTERWVDYYKKQGYNAFSFSAGEPSSILYNMLQKLSSQTKKGRFKRPDRIMVAGIPNVGKSTIINSLLRRKAVRTGDRSGITRGRQWIRLKQGFELLDTAGVLPPFLNKETHKMMATLGVLPVSQWDPLETAGWLIDEIRPAGLVAGIKSRFGISEVSNNSSIEEILLAVGAKRGCLRSGGEIDLYQASEIFLKEFREGLLGTFSLEIPPDSEV